MLTLHRTAEGATGRDVQQALQDAGLAHEVVLVADDDAPATLVDDDLVLKDKEAILARLAELVAERDEWHKYGSDACYCNEDGEIE